MLSPRDAWHATLGQLELQLNRATFDTWLKGSEVLACEDGALTIRVRHAYAKDWLEQHLYHLIMQTMSNLVGEPMRITFVVSTPNQPSLAPQPGTLFANLPDEPASGNESQTKTSINTATPSAHDSREDIVETSDDTHAVQRDSAPAPVQAESAPAAKAPPKASEWDPREQPDPRRTPGERTAPAPVAFNRRCTFESFITGPSNQFAHAAAKAVADAPGEAYNPLLIYGGNGLGKTHLLHAIGQACDAAGKHVVYVTAETFTNELIAAIRSHTTAEFRDRYRSADVLLVDDVQFIAGKSSTEEEFYHVFNTLCSQNCQLVLACSQHPRRLNSLDDRLRSRFEGGLLADVQPPELDTRRAILKAKAVAQGTPLPDDVAQILAEHETASVRELEGLLTQVLARTTLAKEPLTVELAQRVLGKTNGVRPAQSRKTTDLRQVLQATATYHQLSLDDLLSKSRTKQVVRARQVAMYLAREETQASLPQIGEALGRNHSTILHGYKKIANEIPMDDDLRRELSAIRRQLYVLPN